MSAWTVWLGIQERLGTIDAIGTIELGEPRGAIDKPAIYGLYLSFQTTLKSSPPARNLRGKEHQFALYLVVSWVDQAAAETQLLQLLDVVTDAIEDDPHLGGRLPNGSAWIDKSVSGFKSIGSQYRILQFTCMAEEKRSQ